MNAHSEQRSQLSASCGVSCCGPARVQLSRMVTQTTAIQPPPHLWPGALLHKGHFSSLGCRRMLLPQPGRGRVSWPGLHLSFLPDHRAALTDGGQGARVIFFFLLHEAEEGFRLASAMVQPPHASCGASCWTHALRGGVGDPRASSRPQWRMDGEGFSSVSASIQPRHRCSVPLPLPHDGLPAWLVPTGAWAKSSA